MYVEYFSMMDWPISSVVGLVHAHVPVICLRGASKPNKRLDQTGYQRRACSCTYAMPLLYLAEQRPRSK